MYFRVELENETEIFIHLASVVMWEFFPKNDLRDKSKVYIKMQGGWKIELEGKDAELFRRAIIIQ